MNKNNNAVYDGMCAFAVSIGKTDVPGGKHQMEINGNTYRFSNPVAKFLFRMLPNRIEKANNTWAGK